MANVSNDDVESLSDDHFNNNMNQNDEDEKKPIYEYNSKRKNNGYSDLRSGPPASGSSLYQNNGSKFDAIIAGIDRVKLDVKKNIEQAIERNEKTTLLQSKTDRLADESLSFRNRSRSLHYRYCRDLYKQRCVIVCVIIFVIYLLSAMVCGWGWQSCG